MEQNKPRSIKPPKPPQGNILTARIFWHFNLPFLHVHLKVFYKLHLDGHGEEIILDNVLKALGLSKDKFLSLCVMAGCDYLPNVRGIGINKSKQIIDTSDDFISIMKKMTMAPPDYRQKFFETKMIFLHQTVIDPTSRKSVPLSQWEDKRAQEKHQIQCGDQLTAEYSCALSNGNVDPASPDVINAIFPAESQGDEQGRLHINITSCEEESFNWKIPCFPVISVSLRKVRFDNNQGMQCDGVVSADKHVNTGYYTCTSFCEIFIDSKAFTVLWKFEETTSSDLEITVPVEVEHEQEADDNLHTLPFKVMGTCYSAARQKALEKSYEMLYDFNRPVFVKLSPEPDNTNDPDAIAVQINYDEDEPYHTVGYIARELTKYLHPILNKLEVSVNNIRFCTTFMRIGLYLAIDITKNCLWDTQVSASSKKVR